MITAYNDETGQQNACQLIEAISLTTFMNGCHFRSRVLFDSCFLRVCEFDQAA